MEVNKLEGRLKNEKSKDLIEVEGEMKGVVMWNKKLLISCIAVRAPRHSNHESQRW